MSFVPLNGLGLAIVLLWFIVVYCGLLYFMVFYGILLYFIAFYCILLYLLYFSLV